MKAKIKVTKEVDVRFLQVDAGVRYWEDADVNGKSDIDFCETKGTGTPAMPFAVKVAEEPKDCIYSDHYRWRPLIDVEEGRIVDWPKGTTAQIHYKICDDGAYTLLDADKNEIVRVNSYVPDCLGDDGDYIILSIKEDGKIDDFRFTEDDVRQIIESDFDYDE